jgi:hypothetical protein
VTIEEKIEKIREQLYEVIREIDYNNDDGLSLTEDGNICLVKLKQCRFKLREVLQMGDYTNV